MSRDTVLIKQLRFTAIPGKDAWSNLTPVPLDLFLNLKTCFLKASQEDNLQHSLNYAVISKRIQSHFAVPKNQGSLYGVAKEVKKILGHDSLDLTLTSRKSEIRCDAVSVHLKDETVIHEISGLRLLTTIGVFTFERLQKQFVDLTLRLHGDKVMNTHEIIGKVTTYVENAKFKTVEALVENVAQIAVPYCDSVYVSVMKPNAIAFTEGVGVSVVRGQADFAGVPEINEGTQAESVLFDDSMDTQLETGEVTAYIAFGSNVGDVLNNINQGIKLLNEHAEIKVKRTSSLFESAPMYFQDQQSFINGVFEITTTLAPQVLLDYLKHVEYQELLRVKEFDNCPRTLDLDILLYGETIMNTPTLTIPHPRMIDRTFVMAPLCQLLPLDSIHPVTAEPFHNHLAQLWAAGTSEEQATNKLTILLPMGNSWLKFNYNPTTMMPEHHTRIMGILNTTPDSFSDGGKYTSVEAALNHYKQMKPNNHILDIGGCSTRPNSPQPNVDEELSRVVPFLKEVPNSDLISIDTYRASVARAALDHGATIVNDISGGSFDSDMIPLIAERGCLYVLSHIRGDISTMTQHTDYSEGIVTICDELEVLLNKILEQGVKRWQIILDPGLGFAKTGDTNMEIIRRLPYLRQRFPWMPILIGPSRKRFLNSMCTDLDIGTAAVCALSVANGADIVRVHDVEKVSQSVKVADSIYRL